jgi:DNA-directed RNA polymerase subunit RPC12/RpoP
MPRVACPSCGTRLTVTGKTEGRKVYCPCGQTFLLRQREATPEEVRAELAAVADAVRAVAAVQAVRDDQGTVTGSEGV